MEEKNTMNPGVKSCTCGALVAPFVVGLIGALIVGWWLFPPLLYSKKLQPVRFSHVVHVEDGGMACSDCHFNREDGSFSGIPNTGKCAECHAEPMGEDPEELRFVEEYVATGKQVEWVRYQVQPDNVFFSHAAHSVEACGSCHPEFEENPRELCNKCHPDVGGSDSAPAAQVNRITGYTSMTMKMWQCERCHANENHFELTEEDEAKHIKPVTRANNGCQVCHK
jgi:hypothetical protein